MRSIFLAYLGIFFSRSAFYEKAVYEYLYIKYKVALRARTRAEFRNSSRQVALTYVVGSLNGCGVRTAY
jgi:hypothetical protein